MDEAIQDIDGTVSRNNTNIVIGIHVQTAPSDTSLGGGNDTEEGMDGEERIKFKRH